MKMTPELAIAAKSLEVRFDMLGIRSRRVPLSEWEAVPRKVMEIVPHWLPELLDQFRLYEGTLVGEQHSEDGLLVAFEFFGPKDYIRRGYEFEDDPIQKEFIIDRGLVPISAAEDGDFWIVPIGSDSNSPVFYHSLTGLENFQAAKSMAHLISCLGAYDYYGRHPKSHRIWRHEQ